MTYLVGQRTRIVCTFYNAAKQLADPATVQLRVGLIKNNGDVQELAAYTLAGGGVTKESTGVFYRDYAFTHAGEIIFQWNSTGTPETREEITLTVEPERAWA